MIEQDNKKNFGNFFFNIFFLKFQWSLLSIDKSFVINFYFQNIRKKTESFLFFIFYFWVNDILFKTKIKANISLKKEKKKKHS